jgi:hypothetical protein
MTTTRTNVVYQSRPQSSPPQLEARTKKTPNGTAQEPPLPHKAPKALSKNTLKYPHPPCEMSIQHPLYQENCTPKVIIRHMRKMEALCHHESGKRFVTAPGYEFNFQYRVVKS